LATSNNAVTLQIVEDEAVVELALRAGVAENARQAIEGAAP